ncbi:unnamed protein product [Cuscuta epithymum]|uniref:ATP-dependent DNA helicase n=1 Tax=Cuscuta epithymum TaxID=186058 RepID=A0AAV0C9W1_9ASTE|nr:unnamed protein product [Cuscuta epithymum]
MYYAAVRDFMMHGPCGNLAKSAPCMVDGKCTKRFPKKWCTTTSIDDDGYPMYRRRNDDRRITKNKIDLDNRFVVPHCRYLLMKYGAHMNVEWCNQSKSIKYLFKYINKGRDRVTAGFYQTVDGDVQQKPVDEIQMYYDCRYVSACEAAWRIFGFEIQYKTPPVERLSFHLPEEQSVVFSDDQPLDSVVRSSSVKDSMFTAWMDANKKYPEARLLTYAEFPQKFVWKKETREWAPRKQAFAIGRVYYVHPGSGESYYIRCLLNHIRGATSHEELRTLNGVTYDTFRDACYALGLLDDDREFIDAFNEGSHFSTAFCLRILFVILLWTESMGRPEHVWQKCWSYMAEDIQYTRRRILQHPDLILSDDQLKRFALEEVERLLQSRGKSLRDYPPMPTVDLDSILSSNDRLIFEELRYDQTAQTEEHSSLFKSLTDEQLQVYETIMQSVDGEVGGVYFVYGYGGSGKTFVWKTLSSAIRSKGDIVLNVASSGIASLLLPGGRTAHSRFAIPISLNEDSTCNIKQGSPLAKLIVRCKLIIWDEAPMLHRFCFEALDRSMRDIMHFHKPNSGSFPYGGKTVVFGGDFRQVLPVIPHGSRQDVVNATINSSYLWSECIVLRLTKNMRLQNMTNPSDSYDLKVFSDWIASIGDGQAGEYNDGHGCITIPEDLLIHTDGDPIAAIVESIFPEYVESGGDISCLCDRAILAPTLAVVEAVNDYMTALNVSEVSRTYLSSDTVSKVESTTDLMAELHTPEFLNSIKLSGVPNHELTLKVGTPVMLLRNIDHSMGLCNGTRLILTRLGDHVLEGRILTGVSAGQKVLIPRLSLTPSDTSLPFKFHRRQYPLMVSYAMTINKSQGQSLSRVGLLLKKPVFTHGQLYVAVSRVTNRSGLKILIVDDHEGTTNKTQNVVFKEVFNNV